MRAISLHSRRKLKPGDARRFIGLGPDLLVDLAAVVCSTGVLPQKELHECWQMANRVHREFPESHRVADLAAGHGLLAWILVLLARSGAEPRPRTAVAVDVRRPASAGLLARAMIDRWPELADAVHYVEGSVDAVFSADSGDTLYVAAHACGSLSDRVLHAALASRSAVAIMPCCHSLRKQSRSLALLARASGLPAGAVDRIASAAAAVGQPASIDRFRIDALLALGYEVCEASIQPEVTAFNRIIMGKPPLAPRQTAGLARRAPDPGCSRRLGETQAHETLRSLDVGSVSAATALAKRPPRAWLRSVDLSYWVEGDATISLLASALEALTDGFLSAHGGASADGGPQAFTRSVAVRDRYVDPATQRRAVSYRIEIGSAAKAITRADGLALRARLCDGLAAFAPTLSAKWDLRSCARANPHP